MQSKALRIAVASRHLLPAAGRANGNTLVTEVLSFIDGERANSIPSILNALAGKRDAIMGDRDLSELGKLGRYKEAARSHLGNVSALAKRVAEMERQHREARASAVPIPKAEAADVLLDLALVQHVKATNPIATSLVAMSERVRLAVARCPVELSGVSADVQARVHGSLMDQQKAAQFAEEAQALSVAREVVQAAISEVTPEADWRPADLVNAFGADWELPGVPISQVERIAAGGPEQLVGDVKSPSEDPLGPAV